ncbi:MAG: DUF924 family protein [Pseudomonadota bacterium]
MSGTDELGPADVLTFWRDVGADRWFARDDNLDATITSRFRALWDRAGRGELSDWETTDAGTLALVIVLDQFPRNMFRDDARAFSSDTLAREVARRALGRGVDRRIDPQLRAFLYMPFMHSEDPADQRACVNLFQAHGDPDNLKYAEIHADIIDRFGRFPHRNRALNRVTTSEEQSFLDSGGFSG